MREAGCRGRADGIRRIPRARCVHGSDRGAVRLQQSRAAAVCRDAEGCGRSQRNFVARKAGNLAARDAPEAKGDLKVQPPLAADNLRLVLDVSLAAAPSVVT